MNMYVCPQCKKAFKVNGNNKKVKCPQCSKDLFDMDITFEVWSGLNKEYRDALKDKACSQLVEEPEEELIVEEADFLDTDEELKHSFFDNDESDSYKNDSQIDKPVKRRKIDSKYIPTLIMIGIFVLAIGGAAFYTWWNSTEQVIKRTDKAIAKLTHTEYVEKDYSAQEPINTDVDDFTPAEREEALRSMRMAAYDYCSTLKDKQSRITDVRMDFDDNIALYFNKVCLKVDYDDFTQRWGYLYFKQSGDDWVITEFRYED